MLFRDSLSEEVAQRLHDAALRLGCPPIGALSFDQSRAANSFIRVVKWIQEHKAREQIMLLLDEIEFITPGVSNHLGQHWDEDHLPFWQTIRSASQETKGFMTFCVAGVNPSSVEHSHFKQIPNPIFELASPFYLDPLTRPSIRDMVRSIARYSGAALKEECFDLLLAQYGGHPYLIRLACSEVLRSFKEISAEKKIEISVDDFRRISEDIRIRLTQPIKDILLSLVWWYPDEYDILCILASDDQEFVKEFLRTEPDKASRFAKYGLLEPHSAEFAIKDLRSFLVESGQKYKDAISPFTRGDLPQQYLPEAPNLENLSLLFSQRTELEYALRKFLLMVLQFRHAFDNAKVAHAITRCIPKTNGDRAQLFTGRQPTDAVNELYLSDLKPIFVGNWDNFSAYFGADSKRFEMNIDAINMFRRHEAHARPVSSKQMEEFGNSYGWLKARLEKVPGLMSA